jgi:transmembrane sensor
MSKTAETNMNDALRLAEAAAWRMQLQESGAESSEPFEAWLAEDPGNAEAWRQVQKPWDVFAEQASAPVVLEARRAALGRARAARRWSHRTVRLNGASFARIAGAAAAVAALAAGIGIWYASQAGVYRTAIGERRVVTLEDGSRISLDSQSEVQVRFSETVREVTLRDGQARFDVAHDVMRPFSVLARDRKVVATGTSFNVDLVGTTMLVTLIEGGVVVLEQRRTASVLSRVTPDATELEAGEQLILAPARPIEVKRVDLDKATAWEQGRLVFEDEPLASVAARVSRYTDHGIRISDPRVAEMRISGVFHTDDVSSLVTTITSYLPVRADARLDGSIELIAR